MARDVSPSWEQDELSGVGSPAPRAAIAATSFGGFDRQSECHVAAVRIAECIDQFRIYRVLGLDSVDQLTDETHIVDVLHLRWERRFLPTVVPVVLIAVRVEHNEALLIRHLIEFVAGRNLDGGLGGEAKETALFLPIIRQTSLSRKSAIGVSAMG